MGRTPREQVAHFLSDMYSVELQALAQLVSAPEIAGEPGLAADLREHYAQTQGQADLVRERMEAAGGKASAVKDAVMRLGGKGFLLFARSQPDTPGKLLAHAYSYEAMEWAGYEVLRGFAERAGDALTADAARAIGAQERAMMERLEHRYDAAERASHPDEGPAGMERLIRRHLAEAHAIESQSAQMLKRSEEIAGSPGLSRLYREHLEETRGQAQAVESRLEALGGDTSKVQDAALTVGAANWSLFFRAQSDTPAKLAAFVYAMEHLEIAGYELLRRTAQRTGDAATAALCGTILAQERAMADRLAGALDEAVEATLGVLSA